MTARTAGRRTARIGIALLLGTLMGAAARPQAVVSAAAPPGSCEQLARLSLPTVSVTAAQTVAAGAFAPPDAGRGRGTAPSPYAALPAFCRVAATLTPTADSDIKIEVWMPVSGWNGKFQAVGNGGWAGVIGYPALAAAVARGYAAAATDTGHQGNTAAFALGHYEKVVDLAYRAVHEMTVQAKQMVASFYGNGATFSIWNGCSTGGRQGITEAAKYPEDFDAVIAGSSALNWMRLHVARVALNMNVHRSADSYIPPEKYAMVHAAVLDACDAADGVRDGVVENPERCHFDPKVLECRGADNNSCLTAAQVETARALYEPVKNPSTGAPLLPALLMRGSELGWATLAGPQPHAYGVEAFRYIVFRNPDWDVHGFNAATDIDRAIAADAGLLDYTDPNLKPFFARGGKLLMYHGWSDPQVTPLNSVSYFDAVVKRLGKEVVGRNIQLYMIPGMNHCQGGPGTDTFDKVAALDEWIASGTAPRQIVAAHETAGKVDRTRPLCPYGSVAKWKGSGSTNEAANFSCVAS